MALLWDFAREISTGSPGNTTSYFDEMSQSFYTDSGSIRTQIGQLERGHWENTVREDEIIISDSGYSVLDIEHHYNGAVFGAAQHDSDVVFLMYEYMLDVSDWLNAGDWTMQPDNPIKTGVVELANADIRRFRDDAYTLFSPGSRIRMRFRSGDSEPYDVGLFHIERSPYNDTADSFAFSGRNTIGFFLARQTFDERTTYTGERSAVFREMLSDAGVPENLIVVEDNATAITFSFNDDDNFLEGITSSCEQVNWYFDDLPDGRIVIGSESYLKSLVATTGIYLFSRDTDVYSRAVTRSTDGAYSRVCVRRGGETPLKMYADVPYYDGWYIADHRTYYHDVHGNTSQATMEQLLQQLVDGMQYTGVTEIFDSPFRPWLQVGDVAVISGDGSRVVGIISDIRHQFGKDGFFTQFTVTSGGTISNPDNPVTVSTRYVGKIGGANRSRRLMDFIRR